MVWYSRWREKVRKKNMISGSRKKDNNENKDREENKSNKEKKINRNTPSVYVAYMGIMLALAMIFSYIESMIPLSFSIPGIKIGLANIVTMVLLFTLGIKEAATVSLIRILLSSILFGNMSMMLFSMAGSVLSLAVMVLTKKTGKFSIMGVSISGGVSHNVGQIVAAMLILRSNSILIYLPVLIISGLAAGVITGMAAAVITKRISGFF